MVIHQTESILSRYFSSLMSCRSNPNNSLAISAYLTMERVRSLVLISQKPGQTSSKISCQKLVLFSILYEGGFNSLVSSTSVWSSIQPNEKPLINCCSMHSSQRQRRGRAWSTFCSQSLSRRPYVWVSFWPRYQWWGIANLLLPFHFISPETTLGLG